MKKYKPTYNLLIPLLRISFLAFLIWLIWIVAPLIQDRWEDLQDDIPALLSLVFVIPLFTLFSYQLVKCLVTETLLVEFRTEGIVVINLMLFQRYFIRKQDINQVYPFQKSFAKGTWSTIRIETTQGKRLELVQFNYIDFKKIIPSVKQLNYKVTG